MFEDPNFNLTDYINRKFPDEESLVNLEQEMGLVESQIKNLQREISEGLKENNLTNQEIRD